MHCFFLLTGWNCGIGIEVPGKNPLMKNVIIYLTNYQTRKVLIIEWILKKLSLHEGPFVIISVATDLYTLMYDNGQQRKRPDREEVILEYN